MVGLFFVTTLWAQTKTIKIVGVGKQVNPYQYQTVKKANFSKAGVASAHPIASEIGAAIMKRGGNAFDAAIATQLALAVVYPQAGNIGGGGFLVAKTAKGKTIALDYREKAPAKASRNMYLDAAGNAQTQLSQNGHLAAGVPGTISGLFATLPYAKLPFTELIQPAIDVAEFGFAITKQEANNLNNHRKLFIENSSNAFPFVKQNGDWKEGDTLVQTDLANTLKRVRDVGAKGFYEGKTAELIEAEMLAGKGIITKTDLKNYQTAIRKPLNFSYKGLEIIGMPPPSSGGIILLQLMKMIEKKPLQQYGFQSTQAVQLMVEAERRAYADRAAHMGDPDFWKVPIKTLQSNYYINNRMSNYDSTKATPSSTINAGEIKEHEETTHISIIDQWGNAVSITTTLNGTYGSHTVVAGAGFILNNEMDDFSIKPGVPNMYGAIGGEANAIAANKRMLSSMTPTLVLKNKQPFIVVGTPGGTTIPTSVFQTLVNLLEFNQSAYDAIANPRFHHQWLPDEVFVEKGFPDATKEALQKMGYKITPRGPMGRVEVIKKINNNRFEIAADPRGDDSVAGF